MIVEFFPQSSRSPEERRRSIQSIDVNRDFSDSYMAFGFDYFDNPGCKVGYGGYEYDGRYAAAARAIARHYGLKKGDGILEIGCAKGTLLTEFHKLGLMVAGVDISRYAVENALPEVRPYIHLGPAADLPFPDRCFRLVLGKEVLPHIPLSELEQSIKECIRVSTGSLFFEIQCGRTGKELEYMAKWDNTHQILQAPAWWERLLRRLRYPGDVHYKILIPQEDRACNTTESL